MTPSAGQPAGDHGTHCNHPVLEHKGDAAKIEGKGSSHADEKACIDNKYSL